MILAVDQCNIDRFVGEGFRRPQAPEAAADDYYFWFVTHIIHLTWKGETGQELRLIPEIVLLNCLRL